MTRLLRFWVCTTMLLVAMSSSSEERPTAMPHTILDQLSFDRGVPLKSLQEEYNSLWSDRSTPSCSTNPRKKRDDSTENDDDDDDDGDRGSDNDNDEYFDAVEYCDEGDADHDENGALKSHALHGIRCGHVADISLKFAEHGHSSALASARHSWQAEPNGSYSHAVELADPASDDASRNFVCIPPPPPPRETPVRFIRAGKGDPNLGRERYEKTLAWRKSNRMDTILQEPHPNFNLIKKNYPHFYHLRGRNNEPVFFEIPPKTNLAAMRKGGVDLEGLLRHYAMVTEFQWQFIERDDFARSITVIDLDGMGMRDFMGECVDYVRRCSEFTGQHYPERAGVVLVVNVPGWFKIIWNVVKPMVDEVTLKKIRILRGKDEIFNSMLELIPMEHIPPEYGGSSMPLGQSPEEKLLRNLMHHNNELAAGNRFCGGKIAHCPFCTFVPVRSY